MSVQNLSTATLAAAVVLALAIPAGVASGAWAAGLADGVTAVSVSARVAGDPLAPDGASPAVVLRRDGAMVGLTADGYRATSLDPHDTASAFQIISRSAASWADAYRVAPGVPSAGITLRIHGRAPRAIAVDSPLSNPALPDPLYRLLVLLGRPFGVDRPDAALAAPSGAVVRAAALPPGPGAAVPLGAGVLDAAGASADSGLRLDAAGIARLRAAVPQAGAFAYPMNTAAVETGGVVYQITWTADWTEWIGAGS